MLSDFALFDLICLYLRLVIQIDELLRMLHLWLDPSPPNLDIHQIFMGPAPRPAVMKLVGHPRMRFGFGSVAARGTLHDPKLVPQEQVPSVYQNAKS